MKDATSYLLREFLGIDTELDFLDGLSSGALSLEPDDLDRRRVLSRAHLLAAGLLIGSRARPVRVPYTGKRFSSGGIRSSFAVGDGTFPSGTGPTCKPTSNAT